LTGPAPRADGPPGIAAALSKRFERIVVFSGAGLSAESGIPTFRGGQNGLWQQFDPADLATPEAWRRDPALVWAWYEWRRGLVMQAQPHAGHLAVAELQHRLGAALVTQNVDDLHERGGASTVLHLHGSLFAARCGDCAAPHVLGAPPTASLQRLAPPRCAACGGDVRPGVVWFGESLDVTILAQAARLIQACDLLLIVGTSGVVQPAAGLVELAPNSATLIEINPATAPPARRRHLYWSATAAQALPLLVAALLGR
jgi:NAD-dependent deacetylase